MRATIYFWWDKKDGGYDTFKRLMNDASGLVIPLVGEEVITPVGDFKVLRRVFEYEDDHMDVTLYIEPI